MAIVVIDETTFETSLPDETQVRGAQITYQFTPPDIEALRAKPAEELTDTEAQAIAAFDRLGV